MTCQKKNFYLGEWLVDPATNTIINDQGKKDVIPKLMETLCFLVDNHGRVVSSEDIERAVWKKSVVGENSLYNNIAQLRKLLGDTSSKKKYIETIRKKGYRLVAPVRDFENPEVRELESGNAQYSTHYYLGGKYRVLTFSLIALISISAIFLLQKINSKYFADASPSMSTIAVFPFDSLQDNEGTEYFSQGLGESMIHRLSQIPGLKVVSKSTSNQLKRESLSLSQLKNELGIGTILTGSVLRYGENVRIIVQLVNTEDSSVLWSSTFEKEFKDIFNIQDEIIHATASTLKLNLTSSTRPKNVSAEAYDYYLMGRFLWNKRNEKDIERAIGYFNKAIEISPGYAQAYMGLSDAYIFQYEYGNWERNPAYKEAEYNLKRALEIDEDLAGPYATQGLISMNLGYYDEAEKFFKQAISKNPNYSSAYQWYGLLLNNIGQHEKALKLHRQTLSIDPLSAIVHRNMAFSYLLNGERSKAREHFDVSMRLNPEFFGKEFLKLNIYPLNQQEAENAIRFSARNYKTIPETVPHKVTLALLALTADSPESAEIFIEQSRQVVHNHPRIIDAEVALSAYRKDWDAVIDLLSSKLLKQPQNMSVQLELAYAYYFSQRFELLRSHLEKYTPSLRNNWRIKLLASMSEEFSIPDLEGGAGEVEMQEPMAEVAELIRRNKLDEAAIQLNQIVSDGYVDDFSQRWWTIEQDPLFKRLRGHEGFESAVSTLKKNRGELKEIYSKVPRYSHILDSSSLDK